MPLCPVCILLLSCSPSGEWKAGTGPSGNCSKCAKGVTTEKEASTSADDCKGEWCSTSSTVRKAQVLPIGCLPYMRVHLTACSLAACGSGQQAVTADVRSGRQCIGPLCSGCSLWLAGRTFTWIMHASGLLVTSQSLFRPLKGCSRSDFTVCPPCTVLVPCSAASWLLRCSDFQASSVCRSSRNLPPGLHLQGRHSFSHI
jgi:hypothetical protein